MWLLFTSISFAALIVKKIFRLKAENQETCEIYYFCFKDDA